MARRGISKPKLNRPYTFEEMRKVRGPLVYGLFDQNGIFYIGSTVDANGRFYKYVDPKQTALWLQRRIRDARDALAVRILEHNPPDLRVAELAWIKRFGPELVNVLGNKRRLRARMPSRRAANDVLKDQLATCARCGGQNYRGGKHLCMTEEIEIFNTPANTESRTMLRMIGVMREPESPAWHGE
jgi:hypothetical protein